MLRRISLRAATAALAIAAIGGLATAQESPQVRLDAEGLSPRPIEELTGTTIVRHYARAWNDLENALASGRADNVGEEFTGLAKDHLTQRVSEQKKAGVHVRIIDHGHQLKAIFYARDGTAMQLVDQAQLEVQTFDGGKLIDTQNAKHQYMVLMTPGADRWYVRDLEEIPVKAF